MRGNFLQLRSDGASSVWYAMASLAVGHVSISVRSKHLEYEQEECLEDEGQVALTDTAMKSHSDPNYST